MGTENTGRNYIANFSPNIKKINRGGRGKSGLRGKNSQHAIGRAVHVSQSVIADFVVVFG